MINADRRVSLHEFVVLTLVRSQLAPREKPGAAGSLRLADLQAEASILLSLVAHAGTRPDATERWASHETKAVANRLWRGRFLESGSSISHRFCLALMPRKSWATWAPT